MPFVLVDRKTRELLEGFIERSYGEEGEGVIISRRLGVSPRKPALASVTPDVMTSWMCGAGVDQISIIFEPGLTRLRHTAWVTAARRLSAQSAAMWFSSGRTSEKSPEI